MGYGNEPSSSPYSCTPFIQSHVKDSARVSFAGALLYILELSDSLIYRACPYLAGSLLLGSVYWTAVTYGAVTVMQVLGHKEGLSAMEKADPLMLFIGLPSIPVILILGKMIRWEEYLLKLWRKHSTKIPWLQFLYPSGELFVLLNNLY